MNDIVGFKLITGDEIVTRIAASYETELILDRPKQLIFTGAGVNLIPYMFSADADKPITLTRSMIVSTNNNVVESIQNGYIESVSKLAIPTKKIIME